MQDLTGLARWWRRETAKQRARNLAAFERGMRETGEFAAHEIAEAVANYAAELDRFYAFNQAKVDEIERTGGRVGDTPLH